ncbi:MAG TPA: T9SS type A sorting domain-containing protein [Luteibaculaceae bacterium]|nr:T9SS type A sorting domain-containing protein [Luteibaculaceae bacterium]
MASFKKYCVASRHGASIRIFRFLSFVALAFAALASTRAVGQAQSLLNWTMPSPPISVDEALAQISAYLPKEVTLQSRRESSEIWVHLAVEGQILVNMPLRISVDQNGRVLAYSSPLKPIAEVPAVSNNHLPAISTPSIWKEKYEQECSESIFRWAVLNDSGLCLEPVFRCSASEDQTVRWISARTGAVVYSQSEVLFCGNPVEIKARRAGDGASIPLPNAQVFALNLPFQTDAMGIWQVPTFAGTALAMVSLAGPHALVTRDQQWSTPLSEWVTLDASTQQIDIHSPAFGEGVQVFTTLYQAHRQFAQYGLVMPQQKVVLEASSGSCHAYFDGNDIYFAPTTANCPSFAQLPDVIWHEYAHSVLSRLYQNSGQALINPAFNEGWADFWSLVNEPDGQFAEGYLSSDSSRAMRSYNGVPYHIRALSGQAHSDGQILAGALWDSYLAFETDSALLPALVFKAASRLAAALPSGSEEVVYRTFLFDLLRADDNDDQWENGTPHDSALVQAFARHGIYLQPISPITVTWKRDPTTHEITAESHPMPGSNSSGMFLQMAYRTPGEPHYKLSHHVAVNSINSTLLSIPFPPGNAVEVLALLTLESGAIVQTFPSSQHDPMDLGGIFFDRLLDLVYSDSVDYHSAFRSEGTAAGLGWSIQPCSGWFVNHQGQIRVLAPYYSIQEELYPVAFQTGPVGTATAIPSQLDVDSGFHRLEIQPVGWREAYGGFLRLSYWFQKLGNHALDPSDAMEVSCSVDGENFISVFQTHRGGDRWRELMVPLPSSLEESDSLYVRITVNDFASHPENIEETLVWGAVDQISWWRNTYPLSFIEYPEHKSMMRIWPNPFASELHMQHPNCTGTLLLTDVSGRFIAQAVNRGSQITLNTQHWESGVYLMRCNRCNQVKTVVK